jgi:pentachlorophenol monooxygenase/3-(3-hydroxy-phenyl)propionate hydroxylase
MTHTPSPRRYDGDPVVVIGNGPVGQTAALLLERWGIPVVILDARPERDPIGSKAIVQQRDVLDVWSSVGAGEQIAAEGLTWTLARTFYKQHELFAVTFEDKGRSVFPRSSTSRSPGPSRSSTSGSRPRR